MATQPAERPLRADAERNRKRILAAARTVFAARGLDSGLDEIAREAGVGVGTVYRRFPDKELLIEALFDERIDAMVSWAERAAADPDAWQGLVTFLEAAVGSQVADRGLNEVLFRGDHCAQHAEEGRRRVVPLVLSLVRRAQSEGTLRPDVEPIDVAMVQVTATAAGGFAAAVAPDQWRRQLAILLDGLRTGRDRPSALPGPAMTFEQFDRACRGPKGSPSS